jgi:phage terminase large subunit-like protein
MNDVIDHISSFLAFSKSRDVQKHINFEHYKPHLKQQKFHALGNDCSQRMFLAGNRTGKTFCAAQEVSMHVTGHYPSWWVGRRYNNPVDCWALGTTNEQVRTTLQQYYIGDEIKSKLGAIHPSLILKRTSKSGVSGAVDMVHIRHSSGGVSSLAFKSYQQGREALQSAKLDIVHADEEPSHGIYTELLMRLVKVNPGENEYGGILLLTATPLLGMTQVIKSFLFSNDMQNKESEINNGKVYVQAGWNDNPYLSESNKEILRNSLLPHEIDCREKGIPSFGSGMVYPVSEHGVTCEPFEIPDFWPRFFGLDFGWNCTAALFGAHDVDNDVVYFYAEYYKGQLTPEVHARDLLKMGADWIPAIYDPAGLQSNQRDGDNFVRIYQSCGIRNVIKADNSKEAGLTLCLNRMQNGKLKIFRNMTNVLQEFRMYSRDESGKAKKGNDHLMDCMRYAVISGVNNGRKKETKL